MSEPEDILAYINDEHRHYGLQQVSQANSLSYFLPLLHELFNGAEAKTKVVFTILHELMTDDRVQWTRAELDEKCHWVRERQWAYLLQRMTYVGWLEFYRESGSYMISDKGETLMRLLSRFSMGAELVENEGAAVAEIEFSLLLSATDVSDRLRFLRNRLQKHISRAETALESQSAYLILEIYGQLKSAYRWAEQTRTTLDHIDPDDDDTETWNGIRDIHDYLSRLHELISEMQLRLQIIQRQQIDIAQYGLTQLDFDNFLVNQSVESLSDLIRPHLQKIPHSFLAIEAHVFEEARDIFEREAGEEVPVRDWDTDVQEGEETGESEPAVELEAFTSALQRAPTSWASAQSVFAGADWSNAAYRMSLLTLLADRDARFDTGERSNDPVVNLPVDVVFSEDKPLIAVEVNDETWQMTPGELRRRTPTPGATSGT